jgi:hypothetical protein
MWVKTLPVERKKKHRQGCEKIYTSIIAYPSFPTNVMEESYHRFINFFTHVFAHCNQVVGKMFVFVDEYKHFTPDRCLNDI